MTPRWLCLGLYEFDKKTPIVVNDSGKFYGNRCIIPYINED